MPSLPADPPREVGADVGDSDLCETVQGWLVSGAVVTRPVPVTLAVLGLAVDVVSSALDPLAGIVRTNVTPVREREDLIVEAITVALLLGWSSWSGPSPSTPRPTVGWSSSSTGQWSRSRESGRCTGGSDG
jgi:hypothetical protein